MAFDVRRVSAAADYGFYRWWTGESRLMDSLHAICELSRRVDKIRFGTAVTLMHHRHPIQMALEARSVNAVTDKRFVLGLGVSERAYVERSLCIAYGSPHQFAREYLTVVRSLLACNEVDFHGQHVEARASLPSAVAVDRVPVMLGALSEGMALSRLAGIPQ